MHRFTLWARSKLAFPGAIAAGVSGLLLAFAAAALEPSAASLERFLTWRVAGGDPGTTRHSALIEITPANVGELEVAWIHRSGSPGNVQANPVVVDGTLYFTTGKQELVALDPATGEERWRFRPDFDRVERPEFNHVNRGVALWGAGAQQRVFFVSGNLLNAVDARTGKAVPGFGQRGRVDLNEGHHRPPERMGLTSSPSPVIFGDLVIVGTSSWAAHGNVSAYDARTGKRRWVFNTVPHPGEFGHESFGDRTFWREGAGVNVWGGISVDPENAMVFFGTGQPKSDFYRPFNEGNHLFGNSVVALDARTGKRVWHYQVVHRDLWDLDVPVAPILSEMTVDGKRVPVAIQTTKTGDTFIFHRLTGKLISQVEERPVPASKLYGETASRTQPFVLWPQPFAKQEVRPDDVTNRTPEARRWALEKLRKADLARYSPPSERGIIYYGLHGGGEWGGGAYDPTEEVLYVNANEIAWDIQMIDVNDPARRAKGGAHPGEQVYLQRGCVACHGADRQGMENAPSLRNLKAKYEPLSLSSVITRGRGAMPAFPSLGAQELQHLTGWLLDARAEPGAAPDKTLKPSYAVKGYDRFLDADGYPATAPPWGTLNALDLKTGKLRWRVPLGVYPELVAKGLPPTGTENFGGPLVTRSGLLFIGATRDERFRAFDTRTGRILWEVKLPYGGYATPSTYRIDGRQYLVIAATGGGKLGTPSGDVMIAFALPRKARN
jgi:quinoprotein glucose dehydrogenase